MMSAAQRAIAHFSHLKRNGGDEFRGHRIFGKYQVYWILWERLSSRDRFNSRLACDELSRVEAAPTAVFFIYSGLPDKRITKLLGV
jgi:hypothetical protein